MFSCKKFVFFGLALAILPFSSQANEKKLAVDGTTLSRQLQLQQANPDKSGKDERRDFVISYQNVPEDKYGSPNDLFRSRETINVSTLSVVLQVFSDPSGASVVDDYRQSVSVGAVPRFADVRHTFKFTAAELEGKFIRAQMFVDGETVTSKILTSKTPFKQQLVFDTGVVSTGAAQSIYSPVTQNIDRNGGTYNQSDEGALPYGIPYMHLDGVYDQNALDREAVRTRGTGRKIKVSFKCTPKQPLNPLLPEPYEVSDLTVDGEATELKRDESPTQQFSSYEFDFRGTASMTKKDYIWPTWYEKNIKGIYDPRLSTEETNLTIPVAGHFSMTQENADSAREIAKMGYPPLQSNGNLPLTLIRPVRITDAAGKFELTGARGGNKQPNEFDSGGKGYGCALIYDVRPEAAGL